MVFLQIFSVHHAILARKLLIYVLRYQAGKIVISVKHTQMVLTVVPTLFYEKKTPLIIAALHIVKLENGKPSKNAISASFPASRLPTR